MGSNEQEWTQLSKAVTETGIDMIECNFSCPHMAADGVGSDVGQNPGLVADYIKATLRGTHLPLLAKMTSNIGNMEIPAIAAMEAGASGIAAINTIKSIVNVHPDTFSSDPDINGKTSVGGYSGRAVKPVALRFIQSLKSHQKIMSVPVSGMGGIETWHDALEYLSVGCENIQVTTAVMLYGYRIVEDLVEGMKFYLSSHHYQSLSDIIGKALPYIVPGDELDRGSIRFPKFDKEKCVGCGRCFISCYDGGHQALRQDPVTRMPILDAKKCVGCHLCITICPVQAISPLARIPDRS
jgi:dihydropyrimidine dehydrogenase (NAD+) subunit PreA